MRPGSPIADLAIECRQATKGHHQPGVATDRLPACLACQDFHQISAQHMRNDHLGSGIAVSVLRFRVATKTVQEPMHLTLCMMEAASAGPAIGPGINCLIAICCPDPIKLCGDKPFSLIPANYDKGIAAPLFRRSSWATIQPALAHGRRLYAHRIIEKVNDGRADRRWIGVLGKWLHFSDPAILHGKFVNAPMCTGQSHNKPLKLCSTSDGTVCQVAIFVQQSSFFCTCNDIKSRCQAGRFWQAVCPGHRRAA